MMIFHSYVKLPEGIWVLVYYSNFGQDAQSCPVPEFVQESVESGMLIMALFEWDEHSKENRTS
jgi:hypothetical protein